DGGVAAADADLAVAPDLPGVTDRARPDVLRRELDLELVLEAQDREVLGLHRASRVIGQTVQESERSEQRRLGLLRPAKRSGEVDPSSRIRVDPRDARLGDL